VTDRTPSTDPPLARIRAIVEEYDRGERTLTALLGDLKQQVAELDPDDPARARIASALRALGRAWTESGNDVHGTLTLDGEHNLHHALKVLKAALEQE